MDYRVMARGPWEESQVHAEFVDSTQVVPPDLARRIDSRWEAALSMRKARSGGDGGGSGAGQGGLLFDGPMTRLESFVASPRRLSVRVSATSYKYFFTLHHPQPPVPALLDDPMVTMASAAWPLGVSTLVRSLEGRILVGRRSGRVAYHPGKVHPFAGTLEPEKDELSPFNGARRELGEELGLHPAEIMNLRLLGLVEDFGLRQPEFVLSCEIGLSAEEVRSRLEAEEHDALVEVEPGVAVPAGLELTPVCRAALALYAELNPLQRA